MDFRLIFFSFLQFSFVIKNHFKVIVFWKVTNPAISWSRSTPDSSGFLSRLQTISNHHCYWTLLVHQHWHDRVSELWSKKELSLFKDLLFVKTMFYQDLRHMSPLCQKWLSDFPGPSGFKAFLSYDTWVFIKYLDLASFSSRCMMQMLHFDWSTCASLWSLIVLQFVGPLF